MSHDLLLTFWDPSLSQERFELETTNLVCRLMTGGTNDKNEKLGQRGSGSTQIDRRGHLRQKIKNRPKKLGRGHVTYFWNFGTPCISLERFEIETSNLACKLVTGGTNDKNEKWGQRGSGWGHVTYFWNFGTPSLSRKRFELETFKFGVQIDHWGHWW